MEQRAAGHPGSDEEVQAGATNAFQTGFDSDDDDAPTETPPAPAPSSRTSHDAAGRRSRSTSRSPKTIGTASAPAPPRLTRSGRLGKKLDTAFGKVGGIERKLAEL